MSDGWMQTFLGKPFNLIDPREEDVDPNDIIWHLARLARFSGATCKTGPGGIPYVVLQHCLLVMEILDSWGCPPAIIREGGWHECDEPYTGDLTRPLQLAVRAAYRASLTSVLACDMTMSPSAVARLQKIGELDPLAEIRARVGRVARARMSLPEHETPIVKRADNVALAIEQRDLMAPCSREWPRTGEYAPRNISVEEIYDPDTVARMFRQRMGDIELRIDRDA